MAANIITLYLGRGSPKELRQELNEKAAELGYFCNPRSGGQGRGNLAALLQAIASGEVEVTRLTPMEADDGQFKRLDEMRVDREQRRQEAREARARRVRAERLLAQLRPDEIMAMPLEHSDDERSVKVAIRRAANVRRMDIEFLPSENGSVRFLLARAYSPETDSKTLRTRGRQKIKEFQEQLTSMAPGESASVPISDSLDRERTRVWLQLAARDTGTEIEFIETQDKTVVFVRLAPATENTHN